MMMIMMLSTLNVTQIQTPWHAAVDVPLLPQAFFFSVAAAVPVYDDVLTAAAVQNYE